MRKTSFIYILLMLFMVSGISAQESRQLSPEAENLLQYLKEIEGEKTLSGTTANVNWNINEAKWVNRHTGKWPALNFFDFIHLPFSPSNWIDYSNITEVYNWHKNGGIVGCMWHWNMPTNDGQDWTCTPGTGNKETGFDVRKIFEPESAEYKQMMNDIDKVASTLKKLKQRKIPVLWRPLHEAGGQWFWWGLDAEACNELWRVMYNRFHEAGLNNLIWVWTSAAAWNRPYSEGYKWYPGDEYVDIVGIDIYNNSSAKVIVSPHAVSGQFFSARQRKVLGNLPHIQDRRFLIAQTVISISGTDEISIFVYASFGASMISSLVPISTSLPSCITAI